MPISLRRLSIISKKYDMKLIAGEDGLNNHVRWVHVVEDKEVLKFLHGSELILTTGVGIANNKEFDFIHAAKSLIETNSAGWVINVGPYIEKIPNELIDFCNINKFPLFILPWREKIIDVTYDLTHFILSNEEKTISLSKCFSNIIFRNGDVKKNIELLDREGFMENDIYKVIYINPIVEKDAQMEIEPKINSFSKYSMFVENGKVIIIVASDNKYNEEDIINQVISFYENQSIKFKAGISNKKRGVEELDKLYKQAKIACDYSYDYDNLITEYKDSGLYQVICNIEDEEVLTNYTNSLIKDIKEYDAKNDTNYLNIIKLYITKNGSVNDVASELNVHRNTINYKLKFIKDYFNINMNIESLAKIYLAIIIDKVKGR